MSNLGRARLNRLSALGLFATVSLAPLPFGSTDPASVAVWCLVLGASLTVVSSSPLRSRHHAMLVAACGLVVATYALVLYAQLSTNPWLGSGLAHPIWRNATDTLGIQLEPTVSVARNQPFFSLGAPLANILTLVCAFVVCADRGRAHQLLRIVAWSGAAYAAFGILSFLIDPAKLLWRDKTTSLSVLTSTFVNRNTAAVYFGSCATIWLLLISENIRRQLPEGPDAWRVVPRRILFGLTLGPALPVSMFFVCLAAMLMTASRAGVVISLIAQVIAFTGYLRRDLTSRISALFVLGASGAVALVILQVLGGGVGVRFGLLGFEDVGRWETYRATLQMIREHPWFGTGIGTFAWSFPAYRPSSISMWGVWEKGHSTLLELTADLGVPLATAIVAGWSIVIVILLYGVLVRRRDHIVPVAALAITFISLLHSLIDFSLQISGYAIVVFALVGAGLSQSFRTYKQCTSRE